MMQGNLNQLYSGEGVIRTFLIKDHDFSLDTPNPRTRGKAKEIPAYAELHWQQRPVEC